MPRRYDVTLLNALRNGGTEHVENGVPYIDKPIPDISAPGELDPRVWKSMRIPMTAMRLMPKRKKSINDMLPQMRKMFNGIKSVPITDPGIRVEKLTVDRDGYAIPIHVYKPAEHPGGAPLPTLYYIHGGGFFAGSPAVVDEAVRYFCQTLPCIAVSVDYRLVPEHPYPAGHDDCDAVLVWIQAHIDRLGGDAERIFLSGDSAGGNLALYCAAKDRERNSGAVRALALYYPTVNMLGKPDTYFQPGRHNYAVGKKYESAVFGMMDMVNGAAGGANPFGELLGINNISEPYLSPYWADVSKLPPTIILFGEYDFLFAECAAFARKLADAGVPVRAVLYRGMMHAFLDSIGVYPQAEDSALEVIDFMRAHL